MVRDILSEYGRDKPMQGASRASTGGVMSARDVRNYSPPVGPRGITGHNAPGLGGSNYGEEQKESDPTVLGKPPQGFTNHGNRGSQGRR